MTSPITILDIGKAMLQLSDGNPGAIAVCAAIMAKTHAIDPQNILGGVGYLLTLDALEIYGGDIWRLYKDVCRENIADTIGMLRAYQLGLLEAVTLRRAIDGDRGAINVATQMESVRNTLSEFQRAGVG